MKYSQKNISVGDLFHSEYCKIYKSTYFKEHLRTATSENVLMKLRKVKNYSIKGTTNYFILKEQVKMFVFAYNVSSHTIFLWRGEKYTPNNKYLLESEFNLTGRDLWFTTRFEFLQQNSLLSYSFSRQDKKIKINRIISGSVTVKWYECYHNTINTNLLIVLLFLVFILSILLTIKP